VILYPNLPTRPEPNCHLSPSFLGSVAGSKFTMMKHCRHLVVANVRHYHNSPYGGLDCIKPSLEGDIVGSVMQSWRRRKNQGITPNGFFEQTLLKAKGGSLSESPDD
jgi:hypothetical protein